MTEATQASNLVQLLTRSVLTRKLKFIRNGAWPESRDLHVNFRAPLISSKSLTPLGGRVTDTP